MALQSFFRINYNLERIRRIMKKYAIVCHHRKANSYREMMEATKEHIALPNLLNRDFKQQIPAKVLLTDITYLFYKSDQKACLLTILDESTNETLDCNLYKSLQINIFTQTIYNLFNISLTLYKDVFIHSDQGYHYTSPIFQKKLVNLCLNAINDGTKSLRNRFFFEHLNNELTIKEYKTFKDLVKEIEDYINYHNNYKI